MQLSETKCKMLTINPKKTDIATITSSEYPIEHVSELKYLGDVFNSNSNNKSLISQRTKNFCSKNVGDTCINQTVHAIFLSTLLFNCQTWTRTREYDIDTLAVA